MRPVERLDSEFPEYSAKETEFALASRAAFSAEQLKTLDGIKWRLADDPNRYEPLSTRTDSGQFVYRHPISAIEITYSVDRDKKVIYYYHFVAPLLPRQTIFISYSREDEDWLVMLRKFLGSLERDGLVSFWDDRDIKTGEPWEASIGKALDRATAAVLLVSQDFLMSNFIREHELPRLLSLAQRRGKIFWIPVSPSTVFESSQEITVFESLCDNPRKSLQELSAAKRQKVLVEAHRKLRKWLTAQ